MSKRSYRNVQSVDRVLGLLECANRHVPCTVQQLSADCGLAAPTVVRLMETLCEAGYLRKVSRRVGYIVTSKVRLLSAGFHGAPMIAEVGKPYADELTERLLWHVSIATLDVDAMTNQYNTIAASPISPIQNNYGRRLSLLGRAHGRAYMAYCGETERRHLLRLSRTANEAQSYQGSGPASIAAMVKEIRSKGYATRARGLDLEHTSIAVPILIGRERVAGTLAMTYFQRAVVPEQVSKYVEALRTAASGIGSELRSTSGRTQKENV